MDLTRFDCEVSIHEASMRFEAQRHLARQGGLQERPHQIASPGPRERPSRGPPGEEEALRGNSGIAYYRPISRAPFLWRWDPGLADLP